MYLGYFFKKKYNNSNKKPTTVYGLDFSLGNIRTIWELAKWLGEEGFIIENTATSQQVLLIHPKERKKIILSHYIQIIHTVFYTHITSVFTQEKYT